MDGRTDRQRDRQLFVDSFEEFVVFFWFFVTLFIFCFCFYLGVASVIFFFLLYVFVIAGESQIVCFVIARQLLVF